MARSLWKGWLSFGLVNIPVEVHVAVRDHRPHFRMLHAKDLSPVKFERVCAKEGKPVAWSDLVKGYEYSRGHFVVLTKDDFKAAALEKNRRIDILDFVDAKAIDDRYFETPYYLVPSKGGEQAYGLLREALRDTGRIGIAKFMLRETQHLAAIEPIENAIVLSLMRFADELAEVETLSLPKRAPFRKAELDMAKALVNTLAAEWNPAKYTDEYVDNLMKIIQAKRKGKTATLETPAATPRTNVVNLMDRLRESLDAVQTHAPKAKRATSPVKRAKTTARARSSSATKRKSGRAA
jgi:DNA end-binding protein Ku